MKFIKEYAIKMVFLLLHKNREFKKEKCWFFYFCLRKTPRFKDKSQIMCAVLKSYSTSGPYLNTLAIYYH